MDSAYDATPAAVGGSFDSHWSDSASMTLPASSVSSRFDERKTKSKARQALRLRRRPPLELLVLGFVQPNDLLAAHLPRHGLPARCRPRHRRPHGEGGRGRWGEEQQADGERSREGKESSIRRRRGREGEGSSRASGEGEGEQRREWGRRRRAADGGAVVGRAGGGGEGEQQAAVYVQGTNHIQRTACLTLVQSTKHNNLHLLILAQSGLYLTFGQAQGHPGNQSHPKLLPVPSPSPQGRPQRQASRGHGRDVGMVETTT